MTPYYFVNRTKKKYCPICYYKKSKGEIIINQFLEENDISYKKEFIFPDFNKRFDEENLVSLCNYHHKKAHGKLTKTEILKHEEETADIFQSPKGE